LVLQILLNQMAEFVSSNFYPGVFVVVADFCLLGLYYFNNNLITICELLVHLLVTVQNNIKIPIQIITLYFEEVSLRTLTSKVQLTA